MTPDQEAETYKIDRTVLLTFLIPFLAGGAWFAVLAINYLNTLPKIIVGVYDRAYAIVLAFSDMGLAFGIAGVTILCFFRQVRGAFQHYRSKQGALETEQ